MRRIALILSLLAAVTVSLSAAPSASETGEPLWTRLLRIQLGEDLKCELDHISRLRTFRLGEHLVIEGRAHCVDERLYDFSRRKSHLPFTFTRCRLDVC